VKRVIKRLKMKKRSEIYEEDVQIALIDAASYHPILRDYLFHPANGGYRNVVEAAKFKRLGTRAGVSDLVLPYPSGKYHGYFMEIKRPKEYNPKVSKEQKIWLERVSAVGYKAEVFYDAQEAYESFVTYLKGIE
jgi:VRR-NUC domain